MGPASCGVEEMTGKAGHGNSNGAIAAMGGDGTTIGSSSDAKEM